MLPAACVALAFAAPTRDTERSTCTLSGACDPDDDGGGSWAGLVEWVQRGVEENRAGVQVSLADMITSLNRTVLAARDIQQGEIVMKLPMSSLMHAGYYKPWTSDQVSQDADLVRAFKNGMKDEELFTFVAPQTWLALYLMEQRHLGAASKWSPYMSFLPEFYPTVPIFFSEEERSWLNGSNFLNRVDSHFASLKRQYDTVSRFVPWFAETYSLDDYLWARTTISTRVFGWSLPGVDTDSVDFMVPLGDMFNHRSPKQLVWEFNRSSRTLDFWAREAVAKDQELTISYGAKGNSDYLFFYGFVLSRIVESWESRSSVRVTVPLDHLPDRDEKERFLIDQNYKEVDSLEPEFFELKIDSWDSQVQGMIAFARMLTLPVEEMMQRMGQKLGCSPFSSPPQCKKTLSWSNEQAALQLCVAAMDFNMAGYPTTVEDDEVLLESVTGVPRTLVALRREEKLVLRWWRRFFILALDVSGLSRTDMETRAHEIGVSESEYFELIQKLAEHPSDTP